MQLGVCELLLLLPMYKLYVDRTYVIVMIMIHEFIIIRRCTSSSHRLFFSEKSIYSDEPPGVSVSHYPPTLVFVVAPSDRSYD